MRKLTLPQRSLFKNTLLNKIKSKWNSEEKIEKTQEAYFESTHQKKSKAKAPKEKVFWKLMLFSLTSNHNHQEVVLEAEREVVPEAEEVTLEVAEVTLEVAPGQQQRQQQR